MRIIGLMSGTSADGVDACLARIEEAGDKLHSRIEGSVTVPFAPDTRRRILDVRTVEDVCRLNFELGEVFARAALEACSQAGVSPGDVDAIGSHGQTVFHVAGGPARSTLQIGEPCVIAQRTGITTVADFRTADIAAGGTGAPLVPIVDFLLLADSRIDRVALNVGGIANVTCLPAGCTVDGVVAFDTGPGNMVIDGLMALLTGGCETFDRDGAMAASGCVCEDMLSKLLGDDYYKMPPPKSTGRERFGRAFAGEVLDAGRAAGLSDEDILATATALTARTITGAMASLAGTGRNDAEVIVSGGGVHNATMMRMLRDGLRGARVVPSDEAGIPADAKEALAFAVLAWLTLAGRLGNVKGATGASERVVLGKIIPGKGTSLPFDGD